MNTNYTIYKFIFSLILLFLSLIVYAADNISSGLIFQSYEVNQDERTSLCLTPEQPLKVKKGISIEFDMKIYNQGTYGYVFRFYGKNQAHLDMLLNHNATQIDFVYTDIQKRISRVKFDVDLLENNKPWIKVNLKISPNKITCFINGTEKSIIVEEKEFDYLQLYFGSNKDALFFVTDTPPMIIRNIRIKDNNGQTLNFWEMSCHGVDVVYDSIKSQKAVVKNGIWAIDRHFEWKQTSTLTIPNTTPQTSFDFKSGDIFIAYDANIYRIGGKNKEKEIIPVKRGMPFNAVGSQMVFIPNLRKLISYDLKNHIKHDFNFDINQWSAIPDSILYDYQHHSKIVDPTGRFIYFFGGYAHYKYSSKFVVYDIEKNTWNVRDLSSKISPRYLSAIGIYKGKILVVGGYGSKTGFQQDSPQNYYDIYQIDPISAECRKLCDIKHNKSDNFTFSNSLVSDEKNGLIYSLIYNNDRFNSSVSLVSINLESGQMTTYTDSLPYKFLDIRSYCDLFLSEDTSELFAIILQPLDNDSAQMKIYSLAYPPILANEVLQVEVNEPALTKWIIIVGILVLTIGGCLIVYYKKNRKQERVIANNIIDAKNSQKEILIPLATSDVAIPKKSCVKLMGGFQIIDINGKDISGQFSPILRNLLVFIMFKTQKDEKGVNSALLDETFWFDMEHKNALNNRRVNISKLRLLLKKIGDIDIVNNNGYWSICWGENVFCDYLAIINNLDHLQKRGHDLKSISETVSIASRGTLIPEMNDEWIDEFKGDLTWKLNDILLGSVEKGPLADNPKLQVEIADIMLMNDSINENAIIVKCKALYQLGQKGQSRKSFDKFCLIYKEMLDDEPDIKYNEIIK